MSDLNALIAQGAQFAKPVDPFTQFAQMQQIQQGQQTNALNRMKMDEYQRGVEEQNRLRALDPASADYETQLFKVKPELGISYRKEQAATAASKALEEKNKATAAVERKKLMGQAMRDISGNPSDAQITAHNEDVQASALFSPEEKASVARTASTLLAMPYEQRKMTMASQGATPGELKPNISSQNLGGTVQSISTPAFGGAATVVPGSVSNVTMTPAQVKADEVARANLKLSRDRLAAETATGTLTPDTRDFLAQTYIQTGTLPPMGMGKGAAKMRQEVLDRAAQISMGGGTTAADAAGAVKVAKQDTAAQAATVKDFSSGVSSRKTTAISTALNHLDTVDKLADALNNGDVKVFNAVANTLGTQLGTTAPGNLKTAAGIVGAEVVKAIVANGGGVKEREEAANTFKDIKSPAQLKEAANVYRELLGGQLTTLAQQYETGTGRKDFNKKLSPAAVKLLGPGAPVPAKTPSGATVSNW
jgi:hypothetical protein